MRSAFAAALVFSTISAEAQVLDGLAQTSSKTPTLAYSLRKLKAAYTGPAVRVRNATNTDSVDVYFDSNGLVSLSSPVSESLTSIAIGASTANTLTTWAGSGTAFVQRWFDQSGNDRQAYNSLAVQLVATSNLTTNGTSVSLGTAMAAYSVYDLTTNAATTNTTLKMAAIPGTTITKMALTGAGIPDGTFATNSAATTNTTKAVNVASGVTFRAYATGNTYQPGNMLMDATGKLIGIIKSIESSTSLTLVAAAPENKTYAVSEWGMSTQPTLVKDGVVEFIPGTVIPAMRVYNGTNSNTRLLVTPYTNDGATALNLAGVQNMNLFFLVRPEGSFNATNGGVIFGNRHATNTAVNKMAVSITFTSSFVSAYKLWRSTVNAVTPNFPGGINTAVGRMSVTSDGSASSAIMYTSTSTTAGTATSSILGTPTTSGLDASNIQLLGHSDGKDRMFEGLASELIFYGSTTTTIWDETDAVSLYNNQRSQFIVPVLSAPTATAILATTATLGATTAGVITARGTVFGTAAAPTGNILNEASTTIGAFTQARTGLAANTKHYYRGYASNGAGTGYSADATFVTLPGAPTIAEATNKSTAGFTANWTAPMQGAEAYTYTMEYGTAADLSGAIAVTAIASTETSATVAGLADATKYYYRVKAVNATGSGAWSDILSLTTGNYTGLETAKANVLVAPNPAFDHVNVTLTEAGKIEIFDAIGKMVYCVNGKMGLQTIPVTSLNRGLYIVKTPTVSVKLISK